MPWREMRPMDQRKEFVREYRRGLAGLAPQAITACASWCVDQITHVPADEWTADFKGQFRTQDHIYCYPLTIADQHTCFLLACHGLPSAKGAPCVTAGERRARTHASHVEARSGRTRITAVSRRARSTTRHRARIRRGCRRSSIRGTTR
jgi:hypothetical protein